MDNKNITEKLILWKWNKLNEMFPRELQLNTKSLLEKFEDYYLFMFSHLYTRYEIIKYIKMKLQPIINNACIFRIKREKIETIYSIIYFNGIIPNYVMNSGTFNSNDGEWRESLIKYDDFEEFCQKIIKDHPQIDNYITEQLKSKKFVINYSIISNNKISKDRISAFVLDTRMQIFTLIVSWLKFFIKSEEGQRKENHMNQNFVHAIISSNDMVFLNKFEVENLPLPDYRKMKIMVHGLISYSTAGLYQCGHKIIPLSINEVNNVQNIRFNAWREYFIVSLTNNLIINNISPSFPVLGMWFLINGNNIIDLFENESMKTKFRNSELAKKMMIELNKNIKYIPKNNRFINIIKKFNEINTHANDIIMSNYALIIFMEKIGTTMYDVPRFYTTRDTYKKQIGNMFTDYYIFSKYMFEIIYALYCINYKLGIMHGDLHLNNIVLFKRKFEIIETEGNIYSIFIVDGTTKYIFPDNGAHIGLIDFSRTIVNSKIISQVEDPKFAEAQRRYIISIYDDKNVLHDWTKIYGKKLENLLIENFDLAFKIITATDTYILFRNLYTYFNYLNNNKTLEVNPECLSLLIKIRELSMYYIKNMMERAINKEITSIEYPNLTILKECFSQFKLSEFREIYEKIYILDVFDATREMKMNLQNYDDFPSFIKYEDEIKLKKKFKLQIDDDKKIYEEYMDFQEFQEKEIKKVKKEMEKIPTKLISDTEEEKEKEEKEKVNGSMDININNNIDIDIDTIELL